ncbi:MAG: hypothetical protein IKB97_05750 [Bacteroidaceae bacterium]|nr:hypothetical protein [Fibrobacter sp.]MBR2863045.1 hypothetical protein [Bacteroidaceae bacterium]MBR6317246.1 hypothetical protein [Fibrobacter sp.]
MAMQYNFQPLTFADYNGMEREANRRYYDSLGSIGGTIAKTGEKVDSYLQRKQKEEEDKKKWDNMIAEQEYQKWRYRNEREHAEEREAIADARYNEEQRIKKEEARHAAYKEMNNRAALERYREGLKKSYTPEFLQKYGPTAQADYEAAMTAPTLAEAVASGRNLGQGIYQQNLMDFQKEQANIDRVPNQTVTQVNDTLSRENIDLNSRRIPYKVNEKRQKVKDVDDIQRQIKVAENQLKLLEPLGPNDNVSAKRTAIQAYIKFLKDSLRPGAKSPQEMGPDEWLQYVYRGTV